MLKGQYGLSVYTKEEDKKLLVVPFQSCPHLGSGLAYSLWRAQRGKGQYLTYQNVSIR